MKIQTNYFTVFFHILKHNLKYLKLEPSIPEYLLFSIRNMHLALHAVKYSEEIYLNHHWIMRNCHTSFMKEQARNFTVIFHLLKNILK